MCNCPNCKTELKETSSPSVFYCSKCKRLVRTIIEKLFTK